MKPVCLVVASVLAGGPPATMAHPTATGQESVADAVATGERTHSSGHGWVRTGSVVGDYTLLPGDPVQADDPGPAFGFSVALDGDWLAVGAPGTTLSTGNARGVVFLFQRDNGWQLRQRLTFDYPGPALPRCGHAVAMALPHLLIGCPGYCPPVAAPTTECGFVNLYRLEAAGVTWLPNGAYYGAVSAARCGHSVAMSAVGDDEVVLGAFGCPGWSDQGAVAKLAFDPEFASWSASTLFANDGSAGDRYGESVAVFRSPDLPNSFLGTQLAVGAPGRTYLGSTDGGSVYVYAGPELIHGLILGPPNAMCGGQFGSSIAVHGPQLIVGSRGGVTPACGLAPRPGFVSRFENIAGWLHKETSSALNIGGNPPGEQPDMGFGHAVAIGFDQWVAAAAPRADGSRIGDPPSVAADVGMVELRRRDDGQWGVDWPDHQGELRPGALSFIGAARGHFGTALAFGGRRLAVGYPYAGTTIVLNTVRRGQVWIFEEEQIFADGFEL